MERGKGNMPENDWMLRKEATSLCNLSSPTTILLSFNKNKTFMQFERR